MSKVYQTAGSCDSNCSNCASNCSSRKSYEKPSREDMFVPQNANSNIKRVIGIVSGKGGVGKSFTTSYLSVLMNRKGYKTAILDADITGPSIPKAFGIHEKAKGTELGMIPAESKNGDGVPNGSISITSNWPRFILKNMLASC